ncbi:MAG TPA: 50S ribosomal protein L23 [Patescibacteria group bacterium]|nr:50S ribosomal protein L23 [Patescibacteria group bacterium]
MKIKPVLTEKSLNEAKRGKYTFYVSKNLNKYQIKNLISGAFGVTVTSVKTMIKRGLIRKNYLGRKISKTAIKKAVVTLKDKEKIDLFESKK